MKINEVEERVGVTKRNIRYYEKEGLLAPGRNSDNGYRDYTEADVAELKRIKLLRKLDVPLEEIRKMQTGVLTLDDVLRRHVIALERQRTNLATMQTLCGQLLEGGEQLPGLDADRYLSKMDEMEQEGTRFVNIKKKDTVTRYVEPVIAAAVFIALMAGLIALFVWAFITQPDMPVPVMALLIIGPVVVIVGVLLALAQRFREIKGGEEDAASQY